MKNNHEIRSEPGVKPHRFPTAAEFREWLLVAMPKARTNSTRIGRELGGKNTVSDFMKKPTGEMRLGTVGQVHEIVLREAEKEGVDLPPLLGKSLCQTQGRAHD